HSQSTLPCDRPAEAPPTQRPLRLIRNNDLQTVRLGTFKRRITSSVERSRCHTPESLPRIFRLARSLLASMSRDCATGKRGPKLFRTRSGVRSNPCSAVFWILSHPQLDVTGLGQRSRDTMRCFANKQRSLDLLQTIVAGSTRPVVPDRVPRR